jgi:general stress protein 26
MSENDPRQVIWKHIQRIGTCMLVTYGGTHLRARPMRAIVRPEQNAIWFIADASSEADEEMARYPDACLTFIDTRDQNFVSVSGTIGRLDDQAQLADLWSEGAEAYFPGGKDDPSVALLKFSPIEGEYWDAPSNPIVLAIKFLQAKISAERPDLGTHEQAHLS